MAKLSVSFDTRALEVIADPEADLRAARRMRDMLTYAARLGIPVRVPTAVLAESYRGTPVDDLRSLAREHANVKVQSLSE